MFSRKVSAMTGHGPFNYHEYIISKKQTSKICEYCDGEYTQDAEHIFRECEKFFIPRQIIFGNDKPDLRLITDNQLSTFISETDYKWFPPVNVDEEVEGVQDVASVHSDDLADQNELPNDDAPGFALFDSDSEPETGNVSVATNNINRNNRGQLNPNSEWLQSDSESEADIDEEQFLLNANDMANDDGSSTSSESVDNLDDFVIQDEYLDDDLEPDILNPVPSRSDSDNDSTNPSYDSELDPDNYLLDPEGLNLINTVEDNNDSDLENYLLGPDGVYLENQGWSESNSDNDLDPDLDPEPPSGPVDPG